MKSANDNQMLAIGAIVFSVFALSLGDAVIKGAASGFALSQIFVIRSALALPLLAIPALMSPAARLIPVSLFWTGMRSLMLVLMWLIYYLALPHIPLSVAAAAFYTLPMFITLFAGWFLAERVGPVGWASVVIGFTGVALILRPGMEAFEVWALAPLASAVLYALAMILTRSKCRGEHPLTLALGINVAFLAVGLVMLLGGAERWPAMDVVDWGLMAFLACAIVIGGAGAAIAYQAAPASIVSVFDFAYVGFAAIWGFVIFAESPDWVTWIGIALIVTAGIVSARRA